VRKSSPRQMGAKPYFSACYQTFMLFEAVIASESEAIQRLAVKTELLRRPLGSPQ
jgi:hypothetical protein